MTAKISCMRPEARPIEFTKGHTHFYGKKNAVAKKDTALNSNNCRTV